MLTARISIDPLEIWDRDDFRRFLKSVDEDDKFQKTYYIVTESTDIVLVTAVSSLLNIDSTHVHYVTDYASKLALMTSLQIDFHFDRNSGTVDKLNLALSARVPKFTAFLVNFIKDEYTQLMKYIDRFRFELNLFLNNQQYKQ